MCVVLLLLLPLLVTTGHNGDDCDDFAMNDFDAHGGYFISPLRWMIEMCGTGHLQKKYFL